MRLARPFACMLLAGAVALGACGGEDAETSASPEEAEGAIEASWAAFVHAVERGDGQAACAELSAKLAQPNEANFQIGSPVPGGPSCEDTFADKGAVASFAAGLPDDFAELNVDGDTADGVAGAAKPTFAETGGEWVITSFYGILPEE